MDEVSQSKIGVVDGATVIKNTRKRSSIEFICTAVRNLSHHHTTSRPSSPKPIEVRPHTKEVCAVCDGNTNESKPEKVSAAVESQERYDNRNMILFLRARHRFNSIDYTQSGTLMESGPSRVAEEAKVEQEPFLKPGKGKRIQDGAVRQQYLRNEHQITLATTQPLPINDRTSLPAFSGQNTPTHQRSHPEKQIKLWKQHGK